MSTTRIVTWNIHSCVGTDGRYDPRRIADALRAFDADVIGLQEVDWRRPPINGMDQFEFLADELDMTAVEGPNLEDHHGRYGNGLLTRLPVNRTDRLELAHPNREPRGLIDVMISDQGTPLRILVTHLGLSRHERRQQMKRIRDHLEASESDNGASMVLMGDTNEWLPRSLIRAHRLEKWFSDEIAPATFPPKLPSFKLDRILVSHDLSASGVRTPAGIRLASDHRPVCVEVTQASEG